MLNRWVLSGVCLLWSCGGDKPASTPEPPAPAPPAASTPTPGVESQPVAKGQSGTVSGKVVYKGDYKPRILKVGKNPEACGASKTDPTLSVSGAGELRNAVVRITDIKTGKKYEPQKVVLDQKGCEYTPHVLGLIAGATVEVLNPDGILHNVRSLSKSNSPFNIAQPKFKKSLTVQLDKPEIVSVRCDVHDWMSGWLLVSEHPYFSVTDESGAFSLRDVPAGSYTVEVWHEKLGTQSKKIDVPPGGVTELNFAFAAAAK